jgi:hypothetical protein
MDTVYWRFYKKIRRTFIHSGPMMDDGFSRTSLTGKAVRILATFALIAIGFFAISNQEALASCSAHSDEGCPLKIGHTPVFDRCFGALDGKPTAVGNTICNVLRDLKIVDDRLGLNAQTLQTQSRREFEAFTKVVLQDSINQKALSTFNDANKHLHAIEDDLARFRNDPKCGAKAAMEALKRYFEAEIQQLRLLGEIIGKTGEAAVAMAPAAIEAGKMAQELAKLADLAAKKGEAAQASYKKLEGAIKKLEETASAIQKLDVAGAVSAGGAVVTNVGPFVVECYACAGAMAEALGSLGAGTTVAGAGGAACPETAGGGCIATAGGAGLGAAGAALGAAVGSAACTAVVTGAKDIAGHIDKMAKFVQTSADLANTGWKCGEDIISASKALVELAQHLGEDAKPSIEKIDQSLDLAVAAIEKGRLILMNQVVPRINHLLGNGLKILTDRVKQLIACYRNMEWLAKAVTKDVVAAVGDLGQAAFTIVDAGKVLQNIGQQSLAGAQAAGNYAQREWIPCDNERKSLHKAIWGVDRGVMDAGKIGAHLGDLAAHPDRIPPLASRLQNLVQRELNIMPKAMNEGKKSFLNLDQNKQSAQTKFAQALKLAESAEAKLGDAKDRAREKAKQQIKDQVRFGGIDNYQSPLMSQIGSSASASVNRQPFRLAGRVAAASPAVQAKPASQAQPQATPVQAKPQMRAAVQGDLAIRDLRIGHDRRGIGSSQGSGAVIGQIAISSTFTSALTTNYIVAIGPSAICGDKANIVFQNTKIQAEPGKTNLHNIQAPRGLPQDFVTRWLLGTGKIFITVQVDSGQAITEVDKRNNCAFAPIR